jgi:hypothetical protein
MTPDGIGVALVVTVVLLISSVAIGFPIMLDREAKRRKWLMGKRSALVRLGEITLERFKEKAGVRAHPPDFNVAMRRACRDVLAIDPLNEHEEEARSLIFEALDKLEEDYIVDSVGDLAETKNAKGIDWDKVDIEKVLDAETIQGRMRSVAMAASEVLKGRK